MSVNISKNTKVIFLNFVLLINVYYYLNVNILVCRPNKFEENKLAPKIVHQLTAFLKTKPTTERAEHVIKELFEKICTPKGNK